MHIMHQEFSLSENQNELPPKQPSGADCLKQYYWGGLIKIRLQERNVAHIVDKRRQPSKLRAWMSKKDLDLAKSMVFGQLTSSSPRLCT